MTAVEISPVEIVALKKLALICNALANSLSGTASIEQSALTRVLVEVIGRAELANATQENRR